MSVDGSLLQIDLQEQERWRRRMSVRVPASVVKDEERRAAQNLAARANVKGFRKGRVPSRMIEGRFGRALRQETLDRLINDAYREALAVEQLRPISDGELENVTYEPEQDLVFSIAFDVQPVIDLNRLGGFAVERPAVTTSEENVTAVLKRIQEQNGAWKPIEEGVPEDGNLVSVEILKLDEDNAAEARSYEFTLGEGDALPDIEAGIRTLAVGAEGEFDMNFPDDFPDESRRGEKERIRIRLVGRKALEVPDLDDAFAKQIGPFEALSELEDRVRADIEKDAVEQAESVVRGRLIELLLEANPFDVPLSMTDRYIDSVLGEQTGIPEDKLDEVRESIRPEAERTVKRILLIDRVAETQGLAATDEDLDERIEQIAESNGRTPAEIYANLQKAGRLESLEREITERKTFDFLKAQSEIIDGPAA